MPEKNQVNICVAGAGYWGKNLIRNFHSLGCLHSVCDSDGKRLDQFHAEYGCRTYSRFEEALKNPEISGVVIATPAEAHAPMALAALRAGKHVFVEKPLALRHQDGCDMVDTAHKCGRILMVGHLLLFHPAVVKLLELVNGGELGSIEYVYSNRLSMGKIRREENALWSFAPHDISVILALMRNMPIQVTAVGGAYVQPNIADVTVSTLLFDKGTRAHIFVSWLHPYKEQRLVVVGSRKMAVFDDSKSSDKLVLYDKQIAWQQGTNGTIEVGQPHPTPVPLPNVEPLRVECQHFIDCIREGKSPTTPGEAGVDVLQVLAACQRSLHMNGEPVQITANNTQHVVAI